MVQQEHRDMTHHTATNDELAGLIREVAEATAAFIRGDIRTYLTYIRHAGDYTLMTPFGGDTVHGFDESDEYRESLERVFQGGEAELDVVQTYASGDLAVLVAVERQHGVIDGLPDQDLSLRVTLVFRRDETGWWLVHRHADPLVHGIGLTVLAGLARGEANATER
jgi:ketosteroid isomerase-like protein